jgi:hypothetical protein
VSAESRVAGRPVVEETALAAGPPGPEAADAAARGDLLAALARASGGTFQAGAVRLGHPSFRAATEVRVDRRAVVELAAGWPAFLALIALLAAEWALRRRWGLP